MTANRKPLSIRRKHNPSSRTSCSIEVTPFRANNWLGLGSDVNNYIHALAANGNKFYVGGSFTKAGGKASSYIGKWTVPFQIYLPLVIK